MFLYRMLMTTVATAFLATTVFADENSNNMSPQNPSDNNQAQQGIQIAADTQSSATQSTSATPSEQMAAKVDLNKASAKDLKKVKGITAAKANAIVKYRKKNGNFTSVDQLAKVKGFEKMKAEQLKDIEDQLTVE